MKAFMRRVERFCLRHPRFGISNLMLYIVLGNVVIWLFSIMDTTGALVNLLAFKPSLIFRGQIWRLLTFMLIPSSGGFFALLFFYFYYFIGSTLEREWGTAKFNVYFFTGILLTVLYGFLMYFVWGVDLGLGAKYIYLSMFFCFATLYPEQRVLLFAILPIKIKWLAMIDALYFVRDMILLPFPLRLLPLVAVLNYLLFCGDLLLAPLSAGRRSQRKKTVDFRRERDRINAERRSAPYRFRCEVCGRTDVSNPELEFRYCSRCSGYHCYCMDHINNHVHHKDD